MRNSAVFACAAAAALLAAQSDREAVKTGAQLPEVVSSVDGSTQPYALYVPKSFRPDQTYPLLITLHSEESNHRLSLKQVFGAPTRYGMADTEDLRYFPLVRDEGFIVAAPLARGTMGYQGIAERDVYDVLADVERRFPVDPDRVYLTGISMGGGGALWLALTRPDVWAAVAPVCPSTIPGSEALAANALNLPIRLFHGDQDPIVPVETSRAWQRRLLDAGVPADYMEYPGVRHNAWDIAYRNGSDLRLARQVPAPPLSRSRALRHRILPLQRRLLGAHRRSDARRAGLHRRASLRRQGRSDHPERRRLHPVARPAGLPADHRWHRPPRQTRGGALLHPRSGRWRAGLYRPVGKQPGAEGPISDAVSGRQIYVYGSLGAGTADELEARRKIAAAAAHWSTYRARLNLSFPVKPDTAITAEDLATSDLILFGTAETNSMIARFSPRLPLELRPTRPITACSSSRRSASTTRWSTPACPGGPAPRRRVAAAIRSSPSSTAC